MESGLDTESSSSLFIQRWVRYVAVRTVLLGCLTTVLCSDRNKFQKIPIGYQTESNYTFSGPKQLLADGAPEVTNLGYSDEVCLIAREWAWRVENCESTHHFVCAL